MAGQGLVDGIDDFIPQRQARWEGFRSLGPALLASSMWLDDTELIDKIGELSAACMVVSKHGRKPGEPSKLQPLDALNKRTPGMPVKAFLALTDLARKKMGSPGLSVRRTPRLTKNRSPRSVRSASQRVVRMPAPSN